MSKIIEFIRSSILTKEEKLLYKDLKKKYKRGEDMERTERLEFAGILNKKTICISLLSLAINIPIALASLIISLIIFCM